MHHLSDTRKRNTAFMFHSSSLSSTRFCWFFLCLPCLSCVILYSFLKRSYSFLFQCVSQSVCLSLSIRPSSWLSGCRWKSEVTQWATSSGGLLRGEALPLTPRGPNRRGLVLLSLSSHSLSLFAINVFSRFPSPKDVMCKVGEVFLSPCSLCYVSRLARNCFCCSCLLVSDSFLSVCICACHLPTQPLPKQPLFP